MHVIAVDYDLGHIKLLEIRIAKVDAGGLQSVEQVFMEISLARQR
jgi:hypothetical protein